MSEAEKIGELNRRIYSQRIRGDDVAQEQSGKAINHRLKYALKNLEKAGLQKGAVIVDLGCGGGQYIKAIRLRYPDCRCFGFDFTFPALVSAVNHHKIPGCHFAASDVMHLPLKNQSADAVVGFDVYEHVSDLSESVDETWRILGPGGIVHAAIPADGEPSTINGWLHRLVPRLAKRHVRYSGHMHPLSIDQITSAFSKRFEIIDERFSIHLTGQITESLKWLVDGSLGIDTFNPQIANPVGRMLWRIYRKACGIVEYRGICQSERLSGKRRHARLYHITARKKER